MHANTLNVLFQSRTTLFTVPGGDTVQVLKTKEYLGRMDVRVDICNELEPDVSAYDLVHVFNLMRPQEVFLQIKNAKKYGKPVALSTIYGLYTEYDKAARHGITGLMSNVLGPYQIEYGKVLARAVLNGEYNRGTLAFLKNGYLNLQKRICDLTDIFLPNSHSEMQRVKKDVGLTQPEYIVVPNGVDTDLFNYGATCPTAEIERTYGGCILCVARIEGRKCQLNLVRAVNDLPWKLVLIGQPAPNHRGYYNKIKKEAGQNVVLLGQVAHEQLPFYYKVSKVHALISWMETPGLSSLEAGAMGCNLVVTEKGDTRDYFGNKVFYCDPQSVGSIRNALIRAYESPTNTNLQKEIHAKYTWKKAAEKTLEGYWTAMRKYK